MRGIIIIAIILISLSSCTDKHQITNVDLVEKHESITQINGPIHLSDTNYAVIPFKSSDLIFFENAQSTTLTKAEILQIERLTNQCITEYNKQTTEEIITDKAYKVQIVPVIDRKGEKQVWVNCLCGSFIDWHKYIIFVNDGGSCFFNLKINLTTGKYYDLQVNGEA